MNEYQWNQHFYDAIVKEYNRDKFNLIHPNPNPKNEQIKRKNTKGH